MDAKWIVVIAAVLQALAAGAQALTTLVLCGLTAYYVKITGKIAGGTERQAEVANEVLDEQRKLRKLKIKVLRILKLRPLPLHELADQAETTIEDIEWPLSELMIAGIVELVEDSLYYRLKRRR